MVRMYKINRNAECGSCRRGGNRVAAIGLFTGVKCDPLTGRRTPWRGYLCDDHADDLGAATADLADLRLVCKLAKD